MGTLAGPRRRGDCVGHIGLSDQKSKQEQISPLLFLSCSAAAAMPTQELLLELVSTSLDLIQRVVIAWVSSLHLPLEL